MSGGEKRQGRWTRASEGNPVVFVLAVLEDTDHFFALMKACKNFILATLLI